MIEQVYISYFYKIRFFKPNCIPISTAVWDPKWYHMNNGQNYIYVDKNGVVNGLRLPMLSPRPENNHCIKCNHTGDPNTCKFIVEYKKQLEMLDFDIFMDRLEQNLTTVVKRYLGIVDIDEVIPIFIVHEAPDNKCSERVPLMEWFERNDIECIEWMDNLT